MISINLASAGILFPVSRTIMSPGTRFLVSITLVLPSLITFDLYDRNLFRSSIAFSALYSCVNPIIAFMIIITAIAIASMYSCNSPDITAAIIRIIISVSVNCFSIIFGAENLIFFLGFSSSYF